MKRIVLAALALVAVFVIALNCDAQRPRGRRGVHHHHHYRGPNPCRLGKAPTVEDILDAIQAYESGGAKDPAHAVGDHGLSHGWMQIKYEYYLDARKQLQHEGFQVPSYKVSAADRGWDGRAQDRPGAGRLA